MVVYVVKDGYHSLCGGCGDSFEIKGIYKYEEDAQKKVKSIKSENDIYNIDGYYCYYEEYVVEKE